jgi:23S rRNA pseudouridine1911/1915/1917 synthase
MQLANPGKVKHSMEPHGFQIIYEEGPCLGVIKPAGLLTQAPPYIDSLERRIKAFLKQRDDKPGRVYLGVPHRLDRPVSGLLVMAKHVRAARRLSEQFERRMVEKRYWAILEGTVAEHAGTWIDGIRKVPDVARGEIVPQDHPEGRRAVLHFRVLEHRRSSTLVEIRLETGRYHQIRVQAARRGHPVIGDSHYGAATEFGPPREDPRKRAIALHARQLAFYHPMTRQPVTLIAPLPQYWSPVSDSVGQAHQLPSSPRLERDR